MILSPAGEIAVEEIEKTRQIRANVALDAWVVMPNHIHAIIIIQPIETPLVETPHVETSRVDMPHVETPRRGVSTTTPWKPGTLGAIVNQYKSKCTKRIRHVVYPDFAWQPRFYDHIIRDERSLNRIRAYILGNPAKRESDEYFQV